MHNHALKPALQAFFLDSGFARYSIPVLLSPRHGENLPPGYRMSNCCTVMIEMRYGRASWGRALKSVLKIPHYSDILRSYRLNGKK